METGLFQAGYVHAVDVISQKIGDVLYHRGQHGLGGLHALRLGGGPKTDLAGLGVGGEGGVFHAAHLLPHQLLHGALAQAEGHDVVGDDDLAGEVPEIGDHMTFQHGEHLKGRAGEHEHVDAVRLKGAAGGGAHGIVEHGAALRQLRLLEVVGGHLHVDVLLEKDFQAVENVLVQHQGLAEGLADGLFRQVIVSGAQAAGGNDDVRPAAGNVQGFLQALGIVPHHGVPEDVDAHGGEGLGDVPGVGVDDVAEEQLSAHGDNFGGV